MGRNQCLILKDIAFTDELTNALKDAGSLMCRRYDGDPAVYVRDGRGFFLVKLDEREYNEFVRPITHRDPGDFVAEYDAKCPYPPRDLRKVLTNYAFNARFGLTAMPRALNFGSLRHPNRKVSTFYSKEGDFVSCLDIKYASIVASSLTLRTGGALCGVVCYRRAMSSFPDGTARCAWDDPCAVVMPVRALVSDTPVQETRAWFKYGLDMQEEWHRFVQRVRTGA